MSAGVLSLNQCFCLGVMDGQHWVEAYVGGLSTCRRLLLLLLMVLLLLLLVERSWPRRWNGLRRTKLRRLQS